MGKSDEPLTGFSWRSGSKRETTGIWMWSKLFKYDTEDGRKLAIALMDTQGTFDSNSTMKDNTTIFALSALLSSVLIYNVSRNLQEDHLQHLQYFTEYGKLAMEEGIETPFQNLWFLIRDWKHPQENPFGADGGKKFLDEFLKISAGQKDELQKVRKHITSCFEEINCFLMPYPGSKVDNDVNFNGCLNEIDSRFVEELKKLLPLIFESDQFVVKKINKEVVKCSGFLEYAMAYTKVFDGKDMPEPKTVFEATAIADNFTAMNEARKMYIEKMEEWFRNTNSYMKPSEFRNVIHAEIQDTCMQYFDSKWKVGGIEFSIKYRKELEVEIKVVLMKYLLTNEKRNKSNDHQETYAQIKELQYVVRRHDWIRNIPFIG